MNAMIRNIRAACGPVLDACAARGFLPTSEVAELLGQAERPAADINPQQASHGLVAAGLFRVQHIGGIVGLSLTATGMACAREPS